MIKLGPLPFNGTPRIVVSFNDRASSQTLTKAKKFGLDIAELRIDRFSSFEKKYVLEQIARFRDFPIIATIRSKKDGGGWNLSETERLRLFEAVIPKVDAVDIELSSKKILKSVVKGAHKAKKRVLVSHHDFNRTPDAQSLLKILKEATASGADIVKIAATSLKKEDFKTLAAFTLANASRNIVTIAMGAEGFASRIFFPALGSLMTYACLGAPMAPGQLSYELTFDYLRAFYPAFKQEKTSSLRISRKKAAIL